MQFVERYEFICCMVDETVVSLGVFNTYEEANDAAILQASVNLPQECMKAYQINKMYVNLPVWTSLSNP